MGLILTNNFRIYEINQNIYLDINVNKKKISTLSNCMIHKLYTKICGPISLLYMHVPLCVFYFVFYKSDTV